MQQLVGGQLNDDSSSRTLSLDVPFDVKVFGQAVAGYQKEFPKSDITEAIRCTSRKMAAPNRKQARRNVYGFKKSTDAYIKSIKEYSKKDMPFDKVINLGSAYEDRTQEYRNPLFEPTLLREVLLTASENSVTNEKVPVHMSVLQDNEVFSGKNSISFDIGARISLLSAPTRQIYKDSEAVSYTHLTLPTNREV